jgi:hypothetical protein
VGVYLNDTIIIYLKKLFSFFFLLNFIFIYNQNLEPINFVAVYQKNENIYIMAVEHGLLEN